MQITVNVLFEKALQTLNQANEASLMQSPSQALWFKSYAEFDQVLEVDPDWFPALYYQARIASKLWSSLRDQRWLVQTLKLYQKLLQILSVSAHQNESAELIQWRIKVHSERAEFLHGNEFASRLAIADLTHCIELSEQVWRNRYRFWVRRGYLYLMQGKLLSATEDLITAVDQLGTEQKNAALTRQASNYRTRLHKRQMSSVLAELTCYWNGRAYFYL